MKRNTVSIRFASLALLLTMWGCSASGSMQPAGPLNGDTLVLNAGNRTAGPCDVFLDGAWLGSASSGAWLSVPFIRSGKAKLSARCSGRWLAEERELLPPVQSWVFGPVEVPLQSEPGLLLVQNRTDRDFAVLEGGISLGHVPAGREVQMEGLASGRRALLFKDRTGRGTWTQEVTVAAGKLTVLPLDAPGGALSVSNSFDEPMQLKVGSDFKTTVESGASLTVSGFSPGEWQLEAFFPGSRRKLESSATVRLGEVATWLPTLGAARVEITNAFPGIFRIIGFPGGEATVKPGETLLLDGQKPGAYVVSAVALSGAPVFTKEFRLGAGETHGWSLRPSGGMLRISNAWPEEMKLMVDGADSLRILPGSDGTMLLPPGLHKVRWSKVGGGYDGEATVDISAESSKRLNIGPGGGRAMVENRLGRILSVFHNGRFQGDVESGGELTICGLPEGSSVFTAESGGRSYRKELVLKRGFLGRWEVSEDLRLVEVVNESGEVLLPPPDLGFPARLPPKAVASVRLPVQAQTLKFVGQESAFAYVLKLEQGLDRVVYRFSKPTGELLLFNSGYDSVEIFLDGKPLCTLKKGEQKVVKALNAGQHLVSARDGDHFVGTKEILLNPESSVLWEVKLVAGSVRIVNASGMNLELSVDGRAMGRLPAGAETVIGGLPPGEVLLEACLERGAPLENIRLIPQPDGGSSWIISGGGGSIRVRFPEGSTGRIRIAGRWQQFTATPNGNVFTAPPGRQIIEVKLDREGSSRMFSVVSVPGSVSDLALDQGFSMLFENRGTTTFSVLLDSNPVTDLQPGTSFRLDAIPPGRHSFVATDTRDGGGHWVLRDIFFASGGSYRWKFPEESREDQP